jgi:Tfp pilus assembly protein PilX
LLHGVAGDVGGGGLCRDDEGLLRDAEGLLRDAEGMLRDDEGLLRDAEGLLRDAEGLLRDAEGLLRDAEGLLRDGEGLLRGADGFCAAGEDWQLLADGPALLLQPVEAACNAQKQGCLGYPACDVRLWCCAWGWCAPGAGRLVAAWA